jgi:hypothetical protein
LGFGWVPMYTFCVLRGVLRFFDKYNFTYKKKNLLFVDDTLIFCDADVELLRNLRYLFFCFEAASGLKINLPKSEIVPIGEVQDVGLLASVFGCRVVGLHMKYLGLPLGANCKATTIWNGVLETTVMPLVKGG